MNAPGGDNFDRWLGQQLQQSASVHHGPRPMPAQANYRATRIPGALVLALPAKVAALVTTKAAVGLTAGMLAMGVAGAGEAVVTSSSNPSDWGMQVVQQVQKCKSALAPGAHGIGQCVSAFASQHGQQVGSDHRATPTPGPSGEHTPGPPPGKGHPAPSVHLIQAAQVHPTPRNHGHR
jgi:hypothetical protein